jgi:hypothetical protein
MQIPVKTKKLTRLKSVLGDYYIVSVRIMCLTTLTGLLPFSIESDRLQEYCSGNILKYSDYNIP